MRPPEPINEHHDVATFDSGKPVMDDWLRRRALHNEGKASRTYVACVGETVVGYYTVVAGVVIRGQAPNKLQRNMPEQIPVAIIARLAVDRGQQGRGLGKALLKEAIVRAIGAAAAIGIRAILVHALDDGAQAFYAQFGFMEFPDDRRTLILPLETARQAIG